MKRLHYGIFLACGMIALQTPAQATIQHEDTPEPISSTTQEPDQKPVSENAIAFVTQDEDYPQGEYFPACPNLILTPDGKQPINTASAYIGDDSYSEVIEEKDLMPHLQSHYLGYFINNKQETIYLYGLQDQISANNADEETIMYHAIIEGNDEDDNS